MDKTLEFLEAMTIESILFLGALAAAAARRPAHFDGELTALAEKLLELYEPIAKA